MSVTTPDVQVRPAAAHEMTAARGLLQEYADSLDCRVYLPGIEQELAKLPGDYAPPRGELLLVWVDDLLAGCCAMRPLDDSDHIGSAEMLRLYVRPAFRGLGLGKRLATETLYRAAQAGYACVLLDTLDSIDVARRLYQDLGFYEIEPFYNSPVPGAHYLKVEL